MGSVYCTVLMSLALIAGYQCSQFSPILQDNITKYICTGSPVILPWTVILDTSHEQIESVQWIFKGRSEEVIALYALGNFLPGPSFAQRVRSMPNAGIALNNVVTGDSGNYTVVVTVGDKSTGAQFSMRSTVHLVVIDSILSSQQLEVRQQAQAVYNNVTQQWALELTCGHFIYSGMSAPFDIEWKDPRGQRLSGWHYDNGLFRLTVPHPILDGNYTCRVPPNVITCQSNNPLPVENQVRVDALVARVTVLEAQQAQLLNENANLQNNASSLALDNSNLTAVLSGLESGQQDLIQQRDTLQQKANELQTQTNVSTQVLQDLLQRVHELEARGVHPHNPTISNSQGQGSTMDLHNLQTQVNQCCQKNQELIQDNASQMHQTSQLRHDFESLADLVNQSDAQWTSGVGDLKHQLNQVKQYCSSLDAWFHSLESRVNETRQEGQVLNQHIIDLENVTCQNHTGGVSQSLQRLENQIADLVSRHSQANVSFHVRMAYTDNVSPGDGKALVFTSLISNQGSGYNTITGAFTAPEDGTYFLVASFTARDKYRYAQVSLMRDREEMGYGETYTALHFESGFVHALVPLRRGQRVWLKSHRESLYAHIGAFSGALVHLGLNN